MPRGIYKRKNGPEQAAETTERLRKPINPLNGYVRVRAEHKAGHVLQFTVSDSVAADVISGALLSQGWQIAESEQT